MKSGCSVAGDWLPGLGEGGGERYMKKNVEGDQPFTLAKCLRERLDQWDNNVKVKP